MKEHKVYKKMYTELLDAVDKAVEMLDENPEHARLLLMAARLQCRDLYANADKELRRRKKKIREECGPFSTVF